eukprot:CAMPEP_0175063418 /NCGR_PEP_ID=MMETSP0052_2-20121109/14746_1 /TAXON_ID=51329 ORGANISM="Polytomella parva, Strain SAG 63-3" /NCGR_SAMPLE_ID=MMETSP0052_2 /ASSEMBLY_ACC=CAM_ASM_000194 /LENGTH=64 /DNA_ID=CAMNT_0016329615 /DNA_START=323 /DNA_END=517 /DNA_ORIENTATION=+
MGINRSITSGSRQITTLNIWYVDKGFGITIFFDKTEVNDKDLIGTLADANEEIVGLDITVHETA